MNCFNSRRSYYELLGDYRSAEVHQVVRWVSHRSLRELAAAVVSPTPTKFGTVLAQPSADLRMLCRAFERLHDAREEADYNHDYEVTLKTARALVRQAATGHRAAVRLRKGRDPSYRRFLRLALGAGQIAKRR